MLSPTSGGAGQAFGSLVQNAEPNAPRNANGTDLVNQMKVIRKAKLNRQVFADPSLAAKLPAVQASPVYNASGSLITAVAGNLDAQA